MSLSKNYNNKPLVELSRINLVFDLSRTSESSLKDSFINFFNNPIEAIFSSNDLFHCLRNINLTINNGDRIGLLGENGAGKTTLCHILTGNIQPTEGFINRNCIIRSIFNSSAHLFPELTGKENAKILARLLYPAINDCDLEEIASDSIAFSELGKFSEVPIKNYSKGMSARLLLSLITALPAELLILDEIFDGADQFFMEKLTPRLENVIDSSKACLFINHDIKLQKKYCNRVVVLNKGEIFFDGLPTKGFFAYENQSWVKALGSP